MDNQITKRSQNRIGDSGWIGFCPGCSVFFSEYLLCFDQILAAGKLFEQFIEDVFRLVFLPGLQVGLAEVVISLIPIVIVGVVGQDIFQPITVFTGRRAANCQA